MLSIELLIYCHMRGYDVHLSLLLAHIDNKNLNYFFSRLSPIDYYESNFVFQTPNKSTQIKEDLEWPSQTPDHKIITLLNTCEIIKTEKLERKILAT